MGGVIDIDELLRRYRQIPPIGCAGCAALAVAEPDVGFDVCAQVGVVVDV